MMQVSGGRENSGNQGSGRSGQTRAPTLIDGRRAVLGS